MVVESDKISRKSIKSIAKDEEIQNLIVLPPDGGWGWVIVAAAFLNNMISDGIVYTFGIFLEDISNTFQVTVGNVTMVGSLVSCFYYLVGPFVSAVLNRFGFRVATFTGSLLAGSGYVLSGICTEFPYFVLTGGVMAGMGLGMITVPGIIIVGFYFEKRRALATGMATCGSGIGTLVMPPIITYLKQQLDWRKTYFVLGGMLFSTGFIALLYRPLHPLKAVQPEKEISRGAESVISLEEEDVKCCNFRRHHNIRYPTMAEIVPVETVILEKPVRTVDFSESSSTVGSDSYVPSPSRHLSRTSIPMSLFVPRTWCQRTCIPCCRKFVRIVCCCQCQSVSRPMYRDDIFFGHSLMLLPKYKESLALRHKKGRRNMRNIPTTSRALPLHRTTGYHMSVTRVATYRDIYGDEDKIRCSCHLAVLRTLSTMLDMRLLKSPAFLMFSWSGMFIAFGLMVPYLYITDRALASGADPKLAYWLLSSIGAANTVGRIVSGILPSVTSIKVIEYSYVCISIAGIMTIISGFYMRMEFQFIYACMYGMAGSCIATLRPVIVVELFGLEHLTNAYGLQLMFMSVSVLAGTSLAGFLYDHTQDYNAPFYISGVCLLACAFLLIFIRRVRNYEKKRHILV